MVLEKKQLTDKTGLLSTSDDASVVSCLTFIGEETSAISWMTPPLYFLFFQTWYRWLFGPQTFKRMNVNACKAAAKLQHLISLLFEPETQNKLRPTQ